MNLAKLFEAQRILVTRIEKEHPRSVGEHRLSKLILAFQVELGELANEWRGFKFWSNDRKPRLEVSYDCEKCDGNGYYLFWNLEPGIHRHVQCEICKGEGLINEKPLITEYVDCLHFILSIGIELELHERPNSLIKSGPIYQSDMPICDLFMEVNSFSAELYWTCRLENDDHETIESQYKAIIENFVQLGEFLGFTWEQVEQAYYEKNEINHERQESGY